MTCLKLTTDGPSKKEKRILLLLLVLIKGFGVKGTAVVDMTPPWFGTLKSGQSTVSVMPV